MKQKIFFFMIVYFGSFIYAFGQDSTKKISINGVVVDPYNLPVPGGQITIDGIQTGESTNNKGFYKIKIKPAAERIGIYTLPPASVQESIKGRTTINFVLNDSITRQIYSLKDPHSEEVVTTLTSSGTNIDGTKDKMASYNSIFDMIRNVVPGASVVGTSVILRGASSISLDTEALFVVNGTPVMSIDNIRPQEVKSIDVLKGTAASIYGSRGANGVILITLKQ